MRKRGSITGHHIIPGHCFYYTAGLRGGGNLSGFLCRGLRGYRTADAPIIIVTADANGGKSRLHGLIHAVFDPIELEARIKNGNQRTYHDAKVAAIQSLLSVCGRYSGVESGFVVDSSSQKSIPKRTERRKSYAQFFQYGQNLLFRFPPPK